ncbi:MAG: transcriptional regulator SdiA [Yokenella regensburgei]|jgi:LuxR family transcriptional regulator|nr:transcriptional regulator SdiA [Yokenella regensburgei]MDQ4428376.1 transcriptional regulator SdiA [Yokenella regensburgei]MDR3105247.1 transcriptional regulator SdiA [Yokenella regensburgei]QIU89356.1 transcriptional regulator SdiA [Yokenella regensburgei]
MRDYDFFKWRRDMLQHFQTLTSSEQIYKLLQQQTELLEYDYFSLCVRHPVPFTRPKVSIHTSYPERWINQYMAENFQAIDPVLKVENFCRGHLPWDDTLFRDATTLWEAARDNGVCKGVTQCLMLPNRAMGFFSVSRENTKVKNPCSDDEMELRLQTLVELSLLTLLRLDDDMVTPPEMRFSKRELEILKWTAEGKTSAEIAMILSISENTVNFHQKNMQKKFNAPNKTQIACYAAATGII